MPQLQVAITDRLRTYTTTTSAATLHWAMSRNKTTSTLIMVCCLSMMDTQRCLLAVMVMEFYNCHQNEINSTLMRLCVCKSHHTKFDFFCLFWNVSRAVGVVGVQLLLSCCVRCFVLLRKRQASLVANANEEKQRSVGRLDSVRACVVVFLVSA